MRCDQAHLELEAYHRGDLGSHERGAIEAHLSSCSACAEEASAMKGLGDLLRKGLNEWVEQGVCPSELVLKTDGLIRPRRNPWWRNWQVPAGMASAAAAVFLVVLAVRPEFAERMAAVPLLGALANQLVSPDVVVQVDSGSAPDALVRRVSYAVNVNVSREHQGITLTVNKIERVGDATRVRYTIRGIALDKRIAAAPFHPRLTGRGGEAHLRSFNADQRSDTVVCYAYFDMIPAGQNLTFAIESLPVDSGVVEGPWQVSISQ